MSVVTTPQAMFTELTEKAVLQTTDMEEDRTIAAPPYRKLINSHLLILQSLQKKIELSQYRSRSPHLSQR